MSGPIPSELANLDNLEWLILDSNQLSGPIPSELGNLDNLQALELHDNQLSGSIPPSELANLDNFASADPRQQSQHISGIAVPVKLVR